MPASPVKNSVERSRRSGNSAALTQALPKRLSQAGNCKDENKDRMQKLADLDYHMIYLPGFAFLNYRVALHPIVGKLPLFLKSEGEKQILDYAEEHNDAIRSSASSQGWSRTKQEREIIATLRWEHPRPKVTQRAVVVSMTDKDLSVSLGIT